MTEYRPRFHELTQRQWTSLMSRRPSRSGTTAPRIQTTAAAQAMPRGDGIRRPARSVRMPALQIVSPQPTTKILARLLQPAAGLCFAACTCQMVSSDPAAAFELSDSITDPRSHGAALLQGWTAAPHPVGRGSRRHSQKQRRGRRENAEGPASKRSQCVQRRSGPA